MRWTDPSTGKRPSRSEAFDNEDAARAWIDQMQHLTRSGVRPETATMTLAEYGESVMGLAIRGLEPKTLDRTSPAGADASSPRSATSRPG